MGEDVEHFAFGSELLLDGRGKFCRLLVPCLFGGKLGVLVEVGTKELLALLVPCQQRVA